MCVRVINVTFFLIYNPVGGGSLLSVIFIFIFVVRGLGQPYVTESCLVICHIPGDGGGPAVAGHLSNRHMSKSSVKSAEVAI